MAGQRSSEYNKSAPPQSVVKLEPHQPELRLRRAAWWSLIVGAGAVLLEGSKLLTDSDYTFQPWNDVSFIGAVTALVWAALGISSKRKGVAIAGGTLGIILIIKIFVWGKIIEPIRETIDWLPKDISIDGTLMAFLIIISVFFVVIRGNAKGLTSKKRVQ